MMRNKKNIGKRIKSMRKSLFSEERPRKIMSQEEFAKKIGYSRIQLSRFETGQVLPDDDTLRKIAQLTNTHLAYLKGDTDIKDYGAYLLEGEVAAMKGMPEYEKSIQIEISKKQALFELCGIRYETACKEHPCMKPHKLIVPECGGAVYLSDKDLQLMFTLIRDVVTFECFKLSQEA